MVVHAEQGCAVVARGGDGDRAVAVADGVVDEVAEGAFEQRRVCVHGERLGHVDSYLPRGAELCSCASGGGGEGVLDGDVAGVGGGAAEPAECQERFGERDDVRG